MNHEVMVTEDGEAFLPVHLIYQNGRKDWLLACNEFLVNLHALPERPLTIQRTDEPRSVTCPLCKETVAYKEAAEKVGVAVSAGRFLS